MLSDDDVARIARAVADELDERKEARRAEEASNREVACFYCSAPTVGHQCWRCGEKVPR